MTDVSLHGWVGDRMKDDKTGAFGGSIEMRIKGKW